MPRASRLFGKEPIDKPFVAKKVNAWRVAGASLNLSHKPFGFFNKTK
jgi:hypothetical protein